MYLSIHFVYYEISITRYDAVDNCLTFLVLVIYNFCVIHLYIEP